MFPRKIHPSKIITILAPALLLCLTYVLVEFALKSVHPAPEVSPTIIPITSFPAKTPTETELPVPLPTRTQIVTIKPTVMFTAAAKQTNTLTALPYELPLGEGNLNDHITRLEFLAPKAGSQGFVQPDDAALNDFSQTTIGLLDNHWEKAAEIASIYNYEIIRFIEQDNSGNEVLILREAEPVRRGWGFYIFRPDACRTAQKLVILEAPHLLSDEYTAQIALDAFRDVDACALLIAGAHRDANTDGSADVAHNPKTVFQTIQEAIILSGNHQPLVVQFHGFNLEKHPNYPSLVIGGGPRDSQELIEFQNYFSQTLTASGISVGICEGTDWIDLCGETNVQYKSLSTGIFVHLEIDEEHRRQPKQLLDSFAEAIIWDMKLYP